MRKPAAVDAAPFLDGVHHGVDGRRPLRHILKSRPPLCVTKGHADKLVGRMEEVLAEVGRV
jgi:adenosylmethionine-8-amino-7-oxononanoate aminotransferase